jgi:hypothetical protein
MRTLIFGYHEDRTLTQGYEATREAAIGGLREKLGGEAAALRGDL